MNTSKVKEALIHAAPWRGAAVVIEVLLCRAAIDGLGNAYRLYGVSNHEILTTRRHPI